MGKIKGNRHAIFFIVPFLLPLFLLCTSFLVKSALADAAEEGRKSSSPGAQQQAITAQDQFQRQQTEQKATSRPLIIEDKTQTPKVDKKLQEKLAKEAAEKDKKAKEAAAKAEKEAKEKAAKELKAKEKAAKEAAEKDKKAKEAAFKVEKAAKEKAAREEKAAKEKAAQELKAKEKAAKEAAVNEKKAKEKAAEEQKYREQADKDRKVTEQKYKHDTLVKESTKCPPPFWGLFSCKAKCPSTKKPETKATDVKSDAAAAGKVTAESSAKFVLKSVLVEGDLKCRACETQKLVRPYLGKEISFGDLQQMADKIGKEYKEAGYLTTTVYVPPQEIGKDGQAKIIVALGKIGTVSVQGEKYVKPATLLRRISSVEGSPFRYDVLRNDLARINRNPDHLTKAVLVPGKEPQTTDVVLNMLEDKFPMHLNTDWSNTGTRYTSWNRFGFGFVHNNFLGYEDQFSGRFVMGERDQIYAISGDYNIPWPHSDTRLGILYNFSRVHLGVDLQDLEIRGEAYQMKPYVQFRVADNDFFDGKIHLQTNSELGFDFKDIRNKMLGDESGKDVLRIGRAALNLEENDALGRAFGFNEFSQGFPVIFGAMRYRDASATRAGGGGQFFKYTGTFLRIQRLPLSAFLVAKGVTQLSQDKLVSAEQFRMGGMDSVRGYGEGEYMADYGYTLSFELRAPVYVLPDSLYLPSFMTKKLTKWKDVVQMVGFYDFGKGHLHDPQVGDLSNRGMQGVGLGVRATLGGASARVDWAWPVGDEPVDHGQSRVHFQVRLELP